MAVYDDKFKREQEEPEDKSFGGEKVASYPHYEPKSGQTWSYSYPGPPRREDAYFLDDPVLRHDLKGGVPMPEGDLGKVRLQAEQPGGTAQNGGGTAQDGVAGHSASGYEYYKGSRIDAGEKPTEGHTYEDLYKSYVNEPLSPEKEEKRKRAATAIGGVKALGNVANAFSNLVFTGAGAPAQTLPELKNQDLQAYSDRLRAQREAFASGRAKMAALDRQRYADDYNRWVEAQRYNNEQAAMETQSRNAGLAWDAQRGDREGDVAFREKQFEEQKRAARVAEALRRQSLSLAAAAARTRAAGRGTGGTQFVQVVGPTGTINTFRAQKYGTKGYLDAAFEHAKKLYPNMYKSFRRSKMEWWQQKMDAENEKQKKEGKKVGKINIIKEPKLTAQDKTAFIAQVNALSLSGKAQLPKKYKPRTKEEMQQLKQAAMVNQNEYDLTDPLYN